MGDALLVRGVEGFQDLHTEFEGLFDWQRTLKRGAIDEFHDQVIRADVIELTDMGMVQRRDGSGFIFESLRELGLRNFDGDNPIEAGVACFVNFSIPPAPMGARIS